MGNWEYSLGDLKLTLFDQPAAMVETSDNPETDTIFADIDAEVHRLHRLIQDSQSTIYKLRKWQKAFGKEENETTNSTED